VQIKELEKASWFSSEGMSGFRRSQFKVVRRLQRGAEGGVRGVNCDDRVDNRLNDEKFGV
jgi:hypothetical protein